MPTATRGDVAGFSLTRALLWSAGIVIGCGVVAGFVDSWHAGVSLTAGGGVAMINLHWLAGFVERVIQPGRARLDGGVVWRLAGKLAALGVLGVALALGWLQPVPVVVGFSVPVVPLLIEGARSSAEGGG